MKMKKSKEQIEEEKQDRKEIIKAHRALDDLIRRAQEKSAFISESKIENNDFKVRHTESNRDI